MVSWKEQALKGSNVYLDTKGSNKMTLYFDNRYWSYRSWVLNSQDGLIGGPEYLRVKMVCILKGQLR